MGQKLMATLSVNSPNAGRLSTLVKSLLQLGRSRKKIQQTVKKELPRFAEKTVNAVIDYWKQTFNLAEKATNAKKGAALVDFTPNKECRRPKIIRVGYTMEFFDPNLDDFREFGGYMDFDILTGVQSAKEQIIGTALNTLIQFYEFDTKSKVALANLASSLEFQSIICIEGSR